MSCVKRVPGRGIPGDATLGGMRFFRQRRPDISVEQILPTMEEILKTEGTMMKMVGLIPVRKPWWRRLLTRQEYDYPPDPALKLSRTEGLRWNQIRFPSLSEEDSSRRL